MSQNIDGEKGSIILIFQKLQTFGKYVNSIF